MTTRRSLRRMLRGNVRLAILDVALLRALDALGAADPVGRRQQLARSAPHQRLDLRLSASSDSL